MSADRYTLPPSMGGHECVVLECGLLDLNGLPASRVRYEIDGLGVTTILPPSWLTPVKPPPPKQPPDRSAVFDRDDRVWQRFGSKWCSPGAISLGWDRLNEDRGPLRLAVADPFAEPVQLPATMNGSWGSIELGCTDEGMVAIGQVRSREFDTLRLVEFSPAAAREFCRAVWAAANQADKDGTE